MRCSKTIIPVVVVVVVVVEVVVVVVIVLVVSTGSNITTTSIYECVPYDDVTLNLPQFYNA